MKNTNNNNGKSAKVNNNLNLNNLRSQMKTQLGSPVFAIKQLYTIAEAEVCGDIRKILPKVGKNKAVELHVDALAKFAKLGEVKTITRTIKGVESRIEYTVKRVSVDCALRYFLSLYKESHK